MSDLVKSSVPLQAEASSTSGLLHSRLADGFALAHDFHSRFGGSGSGGPQREEKHGQCAPRTNQRKNDRLLVQNVCIPSMLRWWRLHVRKSVLSTSSAGWKARGSHPNMSASSTGLSAELAAGAAALYAQLVQPAKGVRGAFFTALLRRFDGAACLVTRGDAPPDLA